MMNLHKHTFPYAYECKQAHGVHFSLLHKYPQPRVYTKTIQKSYKFSLSESLLLTEEAVLSEWVA